MASLSELLASTGVQDVLEHHLLPHLSIRSLSHLSQTCSVSRQLVLASDCWRHLCDDVLAARTYVPQELMAMRQTGPPRECLRACVTDASRSSITLDELCAFEWRAYLAESTRKAPLRFQFAADGHLTRIARAEDALTHGSDEHVKRWAWAPVDARGKQRLLVQLEPRKVLVCTVSRHSLGGFVLTSERAVFTSWEIRIARPAAPPAVPSAPSSPDSSKRKRAVADEHTVLKRARSYDIYS
ncbi:hypothetical protein AB1Y20_001634 [Prymnesium parvum]|uniref:F-box domain-containing protein n=1 Tax=Prymnesium parvum TaxID=97485 RepID=A0AB34K979_PRYPA